MLIKNSQKRDDKEEKGVMKQISLQSSTYLKDGFFF